MSIGTSRQDKQEGYASLIVVFVLFCAVSGVFCPGRARLRQRGSNALWRWPANGPCWSKSRGLVEVTATSP